MSKPQDYEYKTNFEHDPEDIINELAKDGWEPIASNTYSYDEKNAVYTLLRRIRPDVKTEAAG